MKYLIIFSYTLFFILILSYCSIPSSSFYSELDEIKEAEEEAREKEAREKEARYENITRKARVTCKACEEALSCYSSLMTDLIRDDDYFNFPDREIEDECPSYEECLDELDDYYRNFSITEERLDDCEIDFKEDKDSHDNQNEEWKDKYDEEYRYYEERMLRDFHTLKKCVGNTLNHAKGQVCEDAY